MELNLSGLSKNMKENDVDKIHDVLIIGAGPAGMSAALYTARADLQPLLFTGMALGGQASLTNVIENYPGFPDGVGGGELGELFQKQAENFGAQFIFDTVTDIDLSESPFKAKTYSNEYLCKTVIIATGASPNHLEVPGEKKLSGKGVSYCATCDGWFFRDKKVVVVGGGDSALEEALFLTRFASSIDVVHRRDELRAGAILQKRAKFHPKISFIWDSVISEIIGENAVNAVKIRNVKTGEEKEIPTEGVFIFIGHKPNSDMFVDQLELDDLGYLVSDMKMTTKVPGVYVAGEIADPHYRQVITSAGMGAAAAIEVTRFLEREEN
jgi:thioredoxin reductase (NADPH)